MSIENRKEFQTEIIGRVLNSAPVSEILRVYSLFLQSELEKLDDEDFLQAALNAGYTDLIEKYSSAEAFFESENVEADLEE